MLAALEMKSSPTAPPAYAAIPSTNAALSVLQNAVASGTGANEVMRNEKAAYGAATEVLKDDETTRMLKMQVNEYSLAEMRAAYQKLKRQSRLLHYGELLCLALVLGLTFTLMASSTAAVLQSALQQVGITGHVVTGILTSLAIFLQHHRTRVLKRKRSVKRDIVKRMTYISLARRMGTRSPETGCRKVTSGLPHGASGGSGTRQG
uniref:Non-structural protein NS3 n=1 Tax=Broadhaven virus TaxID=10893 RepID=VNS3_BRD|nr:RecName: Full=Non-structural protein NS3; Contains: RecName: Full=Non-structural protein NS3A [Broadhaven virus]